MQHNIKLLPQLWGPLCVQQQGVCSVTLIKPCWVIKKKRRKETKYDHSNMQVTHEEHWLRVQYYQTIQTTKSCTPSKFSSEKTEALREHSDFKFFILTDGKFFHTSKMLGKKETLLCPEISWLMKCAAAQSTCFFSSLFLRKNSFKESSFYCKNNLEGINSEHFY